MNGEEANSTASPVRIDCDFPGGNTLVDRIDGDEVYLRQDPRDTPGFWFYWSYRVRGAEGRRLTFRFTGGKVVGVRGPAVSRNGGETWQWLDDESVTPESFTYQFCPEEAAVRFCLAMPYQRGNLEAMFREYAGRDDFVVENHAKSRKGRSVPRIRFGCLEGGSEHRVLLACRHHACEMMASWVLEGVIESVLADSDRGRWLREHVEFLCVPMMDYDGVEDGDQGKNRAPHDHNRDYLDEPVYPEVAALRELVPKWSGGRLRLAIDLHCPYIRSGNNQEIFFVGGPDEEMAERLAVFSKLLESVQTGPLRYDSKHNIPWGESWNNMDEARSFGRWAALLPGIELATTLETPYADAGDRPVTIESARALGRDLAGTIEKWLQDGETK
jgi:zinc carboxypeptidase